MITSASWMMLFNLALLRAAAGCAGDACTAPCTCKNADDVECVNAQLTSVPCHIPADSNGVYLSNNSISSVSAGDLANHTALQYLFMDHNLLTEIGDDFFGGGTLPQLGELFAPNNHISSVSPAALRAVPMLAYMELNDNELTAVPDLAPLQHIAMLSLANNKIRAITNSTFAAVSTLSSIELQGNQISTVAHAAFATNPILRRYNGRLCLGRNPLNCCGLEWLRELPALDALCDDLGGPATCASPVALAGKALKRTSGTLCP